MEIVSVYVGLDYHSDSIRVCVMTSEGQELWNRSVRSTVGHVVEAVKNCADAILVQGVAIEACTGSAEFSARLREATEGTVKLAHASAVHRLKQGPDKTDHGDAWHLANLIRVNYLPEVWLADETTRQLRHLVRYRQSLMADAKDIKLRIRSRLKEEVVSETCPQQAWTKAWLEWLKAVALPQHSRWILDQQLTLLNQLQEKIQEVDQRLEEATDSDPLTKKLREQAGVGLVTAMLLRAVLGRVDRFKMANSSRATAASRRAMLPAASDKQTVDSCLPAIATCGPR